VLTPADSELFVVLGILSVACSLYYALRDSRSICFYVGFVRLLHRMVFEYFYRIFIGFLVVSSFCFYDCQSLVWTKR